MELYGKDSLIEEVYLYNTEEELYEHAREMLSKGYEVADPTRNSKKVLIVGSERGEIARNYPNIMIHKAEGSGKIHYVWQERYRKRVEDKDTSNCGPTNDMS